MNAADGPAFRTEPVLGWRSWRVLPYRGTNGSQEHRLCAVGTLGRPKVWEPRQPIAAVCSAYNSRHAAPSFRHECGLWALNDRDESLRRLAAYVETQGGLVSGWAFGQVSLWGRLIEHEAGWRAQYAYPFAIKVITPERRVADAIARAYGVEVEWDPVLSSMLHAAERDRRARDGLNDLIRELRDLRRELETDETRRLLDEAQQLTARNVARPAAPIPEQPAAASAAGPVRLDMSGVDDNAVLLAVAVATTRQLQRPWGLRWPLPDTPEVLAAIAWRLDPPLQEPHAPDDRRAFHRLCGLLRKLAADGLVESGVEKDSRQNRCWRLTPAGCERIRAAGLPARVIGWDWARGDDRRLEFTAADIDRALSVPCPPFDHEVKAMHGEWAAARRLAEAQGRRAYRTWLVEWRAESARLDLNRLPFDDEEVLAALAAIAKRDRGPVLASAILEQLAPGKPSHSEVGRLSQALVRLRKARLVEIAEASTPKLWQPVS